MQLKLLNNYQHTVFQLLSVPIKVVIFKKIG